MSRENPTQEELSIAAKSLGIQVDKINDVKKIMDTLNTTLGADADYAIEALLALNINIIQAVELVLEQMKVNQDMLYLIHKWVSGRKVDQSQSLDEIAR